MGKWNIATKSVCLNAQIYSTLSIQKILKCRIWFYVGYMIYVGYDSDLMWVYVIVFNEKNVSFFFEICNYSYYFHKFLIIVAFYWGVKRLYSYIFFLYLLFILFIFLGTTSIKIKCLSYTYFSAMPRTLSIARKVSSAGIHSSVG